MRLPTFILETSDGKPARDAIRMLAEGGVPYREIAKEMQISLSTLCSVLQGLGIRRRRGGVRGPETPVTLTDLAAAATRCLVEAPQVEPPAPPSPEPGSRQALILDMVGVGLNFKQIAEHFGVTRERIRQICAEYGVTGRQLQQDRKADAKPKRKLQGFKLAMYRHLRACGFYRCCYCGWQGREKFSLKIQNVCRECNNTRISSKYLDDQAWRDHLKEYNSTPERKAKYRKYQREYAKRDYVKKQRKERAAAQRKAEKADPALQERRRAEWRAIYRRRKAKIQALKEQSNG